MPTYKVTFEPTGVTVEVDPALYPYTKTGLPGSLLDIALSHGVQIEHACGGVGVRDLPRHRRGGREQSFVADRRRARPR